MIARYIYLTKGTKYFYNKNMKKLSKVKNIFALAIMCVVSLFALTACGTEGSSVVQAILFVKDVYYVDLNVETFLDYKVYPATSTGYEASFMLDNTYTADASYFTFKNGTVLVSDSRFSEIVVNVRINDKQDSCKVKLREYPTNVEFEKSSETLYCGGVKTLELKGLFSDGVRNCLQSEFNYKITSSNPSVVEVLDSENLLVASTGKSGSSDITVEILNSKGESKGLVASTKIDCQNNIAESFAVMGQNVLKNNAELQLSAVLGDRYNVGVKYFDAENFLIEDVDFDILFNNEEVFAIAEESGRKVLTVIGEGEVSVTIQSRGVNSDGVPSKIFFKITVQFSS